MIRRSTWILLGVFVLLLGLLYFLQQDGAGAPDEAALPTSAVMPNLFAFSMDEITGFRIANLDGLAVEAEKAGDVWQLVQPQAAAELVDQSRIEGLLAQLTGVRLLTDADINASLSALKLQYPPHRLTITLAGGGTVVVAIGDTSVTNTGYYVSVDGGEPRLVSKMALDSFLGLLEAPPLLPTPVPTVETPLDEGAPTATP